MKSLYTRFVLWLIRPALDLKAEEFGEWTQFPAPADPVDALIRDIKAGGQVSRALEHSYGLKRRGK